MPFRQTAVTWVFAAVILLSSGCHSVETRHRHSDSTITGAAHELQRTGDEIIVAGRFFHTDTPVLTWLDPGGYDAYRVDRRFAPLQESSWVQSQGRNPSLKTPNRYGQRTTGLSPSEQEHLRQFGWSLEKLRNQVDQVVLHFDACGTSELCFKVLHDERCLSCHFLLDLDGTLYQTLDLKERAWHATISNTRSIGIEIANIGAFSHPDASRLKRWYKTDSKGQTVIRIPQPLGEGGIRTPDFVARPARSEPVSGIIQGKTLHQYDFTDQQYEALINLLTTLCQVFPKITPDFPRDDIGQLKSSTLLPAEWKAFSGILGHYHVQSNKVDPGPAFDWERVIQGVRASL